jgi:hypothetical protein
MGLGSQDSRRLGDLGVEGEEPWNMRIKRISTAGIAEAIAKAELYRSLNEPEEAESICRDILAIEPQHQLALRLLGLALTDQFTGGKGRIITGRRGRSSDS